jgi:hypothetical protein
LGDTPMIGFSSPAGLTTEGLRPNSVIVVLLAGDLQAETHWLPGYAQSARETGVKLSKYLMDRLHLPVRSLQATCIRVIPTRSLARRLELAR